MTVASIAASPDRRGRYRVEFSDGSAMKLPPSVIADLCLYTGRELDESELRRVREAERKADAKQRAVNIISATTVSGRELSDRLRRKGASEADAAEAVQWLQELCLVDDARTARQIVERGVRRGYGARRIRQILFEKKIPREYWDEAMEAVPEPDGAIDDYLRANLRGAPDQKERKRVSDALVRRGFDWSDISAGLRRYGAELEAMEEE